MKITISFVACMLHLYLLAQPPAILSSTANTASPNQFDKYELTIALNANYSNPYNFNDIALQATFVGPSGKSETVDGFYMQDYLLNTTTGNVTPQGGAQFKVRYTPKEFGAYSYTLQLQTQTGNANWPATSFIVANRTAKGFIRKNNTNYLSFDDGSQYLPIGQNLCWQQNNRYLNYKEWMAKMAANNANFYRLWLCHWGMGIEWKNGYDAFNGLGQYKQSNAFFIDWLLNESAAQGMYMMLCINHHGQVSTTTDANWSDNPYNTANGGPCANTWDFFTNSAAIQAHKNRLRYIVARWGYSPNIQSWELFNEVDWTDNFGVHQLAIKNWHQEMANYLKQIDANNHLVTTSFARDTYDPDTWNIPAIDFTQTHYYSGSENIETILVAGNRNYLSSYAKPTFNGEFGLSTSGPSLATDPGGNHLHNSIWATTFGGGMGAGATWYWDTYVDAGNLYQHFLPLANVVAGIPFKGANMKPVEANINSSMVADISIAPGAGFGLAPAGDFAVSSNGTMSPGANQLSQYLFGSLWNTQNRRPPTFTVNYPVAGQFRVATGNSTGTLPTVAIFVDGIQVLNQNAAINTTYTVSIPAGNHTIRVDNLGTDWIQINTYTFTNIGTAINAFVLKAAAANRSAGWLHNKRYNFQAIANNSLPPLVADAQVQIPGMQNGNYLLQFYNCSTGAQISSTNLVVANGTLSFTAPPITWDMAFIATEGGVLSSSPYSFTGLALSEKNKLLIEISHQFKTKEVMLERSVDGKQFQLLNKVSETWPAPTGSYEYIDENPLWGANYYRLAFLLPNGTVSYSKIIRLVQQHMVAPVFPNPTRHRLSMQLPAGNFVVQLLSNTGTTLQSNAVNFTNRSLFHINVSHLPAGIYYVLLFNQRKELIGKNSFIKE